MKKEKKKMFVVGGLRLGSSPVEFLINETKGDRIEQWNKWYCINVADYSLNKALVSFFGDCAHKLDDEVVRYWLVNFRIHLQSVEFLISAEMDDRMKQ